MIRAHVFRQGREVTDIEIDTLSEVRTEKGTLVWVDIVSATEQELAQMREEFGIHGGRSWRTTPTRCCWSPTAPRSTTRPARPGSTRWTSSPARAGRSPSTAAGPHRQRARREPEHVLQPRQRGRQDAHRLRRHLRGDHPGHRGLRHELPAHAGAHLALRVRLRDRADDRRRRRPVGLGEPVRPRLAHSSVEQTPRSQGKELMDTARSSDGTTIAFDRLGEGAPVVLVSGASTSRGIHAAGRPRSSGTPPARSSSCTPQRPACPSPSWRCGSHRS